jgi:hypothetical protein
MPSDSNAAKKKLTLSKETLENLRVRTDVRAGFGADSVPPYPVPHPPTLVLPK